MSDRTFIAMPEGNGGFGGNGATDFMLGSMMGNGGCMGGNGMWNSPWWALIFLSAFRNGGFFGNDNNGNSQISAIQEQLNTIQGQNALMSAIQGGTNEVRSLASTLNCDVNAVQAGINAVQGAICNVGAKNDMNFMQVLNAVSNNRSDIVNQLSSCCCDIRTSILNQTNQLDRSIERVNDTVVKGLCDTAYATKEQTCALQQSINDSNRAILAKLDAIEDSRKDREIAALTAQNATLVARAERQQELAPIYKALGDIQCRQPQTITIPANNGLYLDNCALSTLRLRELALAAGYTLTPAAGTAAA